MLLSNNIRFLRKQKGWSQDMLAEMLGYKSYTTIQKWESGVSEPPIKKLKALSELFHVDMDDLNNKNLSCCESAAHEDDSASLSAAESELVDKFRQLNPDGQEKLLDYAEDLTEMPKYKKGHQHEAVEKEA